MNKTIFWFPRWLILKPYRWYIALSFIIPSYFFIDKWLSAPMQVLPALFLAWLLVGALTTRSKHDQLLLGLFVVVATIFEMIATFGLGWYTYRLENIPLWVPPGHGIVFLTAYIWAASHYSIKNEQIIKYVITTGAVSYAIFGLMQPAIDITGAVFGGLFLIWLWGFSSHKTRFYSALWVVVCYLEICGVAFGAWQWSAVMPITGWTEANPPSGIVGAYGGFDLITFGIVAYIIKLKKQKKIGFVSPFAYLQNVYAIAGKAFNKP